MKTLGPLKVNSPTVVHEAIDGETIILNLDSGFYFSLVETGAKIWDLLASMNSADDIAKKMCLYYEGNDDEIDITVHSFISELIAEGLIVSGQETATAPSCDASSVSQSDERTIKIEFMPPILNKYSDMQDLLLLDPIHEVDVDGWPTVKPL